MSKCSSPQKKPDSAEAGPPPSAWRASPAEWVLTSLKTLIANRYSSAHFSVVCTVSLFKSCTAAAVLLFAFMQFQNSPPLLNTGNISFVQCNQTTYNSYKLTKRVLVSWSLNIFKEILFNPKRKVQLISFLFWKFSFTHMLFETCVTDFLLWSTKGNILKDHSYNASGWGLEISSSKEDKKHHKSSPNASFCTAFPSFLQPYTRFIWKRLKNVFFFF